MDFPAIPALNELKERARVWVHEVCAAGACVNPSGVHGAVPVDTWFCLPAPARPPHAKNAQSGLAAYVGSFAGGGGGGARAGLWGTGGAGAGRGRVSDDGQVCWRETRSLPPRARVRAHAACALSRRRKATRTSPTGSTWSG